MSYDPDTAHEVPPVPRPGSAEEPAVSTGSVIAAVTAVIALVVSLGLPISADTQTAILALVAIVAPFVVGWVARGKVWAPASVARLVAVERQKAVQGR